LKTWGTPAVAPAAPFFSDYCFFSDSCFAGGVFLATQLRRTVPHSEIFLSVRQVLGLLHAGSNPTFDTFNTNLYQRMTNHYGPFPWQRV
jgi:hypothetical protein